MKMSDYREIFLVFESEDYEEYARQELGLETLALLNELEVEIDDDFDFDEEVLLGEMLYEEV